MKKIMENYPIKKLETPDWPELLFEMSDPPIKLNYRGQKPIKDSKFLCIVGSRKYSDYGEKVCQELIPKLSRFPITIVSGLAFGIDSIAHKIAIENGINTIACPGSGLNEDAIYPRAHFNLAEKILQSGGTLVSEFENDMQATNWTFPKRNRLMAGISHATIIIEAAEKSGTMITGRLALDYNRDVMAVPGSIFNKNSIGTNMLISIGASPINRVEDIIRMLGFEDQTEKADQDYNMLSPNEKIIMNAIENPLSKDEILLKTKMEINLLNETITLLEMKDLILEIGGKICQK